jgi:hypothetical protein
MIQFFKLQSQLGKFTTHNFSSELFVKFKKKIFSLAPTILLLLWEFCSRAESNIHLFFLHLFCYLYSFTKRLRLKIWSTVVRLILLYFNHFYKIGISFSIRTKIPRRCKFWWTKIPLRS